VPNKARKGAAELERVGVAIDKELLHRFDGWLAARGGGNRSEALRDLIRDRLIGADIADRTEVVATVSLVYDHHHRTLDRRLTGLQHEQGDHVVSALHVHLTGELCLEVVVVRGPAVDVRRFADRLIGEKGVLHGGVFVTRSPSPASPGPQAHHGHVHRHGGRTHRHA
jgi:CopG family nickel-responsive transcriptional regulator